MMTLLEKTFTNLKEFTGFTSTYMASNSDPLLPIDQPHRDRKDQTRAVQEDTISSGRSLGHQVGETLNTHVSEGVKESSSRDRTDVDCQSSVQVPQEPRNSNAGHKAQHGPSSNTRYQTRRPTDENESLKTQLQVKQRDLAQATKQSGELQRRVQKLEGEKEALLGGFQVERDNLHRRKVEAENQMRDLQGRNRRLEDELKTLKGILRGVQEKQLQTVKLLEERTADLKGAQTFLTTADRYAGADIVKMVEALNAEIFQGAALISELIGDETMMLEVVDRKKNAKGTQGAKDFLAQHIGRELVEYLATKSKQVQADPLPLQLAVQSILTNWCVSMVGNLCVGPASNDMIEIYRRIWESESQAVAGRWRALTVGQAKHLDSTTHKDLVIEVLSALLRISGSPMANLNSQKTDLFLEKVVSTIIDMWMQLKTAIQEGVTATEMQVFDAHPNDIYEDAAMNDIYADAEDVQQPDLGKRARHILCTVGMGLRRSVIKRDGDGKTFIQNDTTLKAKVAFPSVLLDAA